MTGMNRPWQISLGYLMLDIFWIAAALALVIQAIRYPRPHEGEVQILLVLLGAACAGAAIGGLFREMTMGFLWAFFAGIYCFAAFVVIWARLALIGG